MIDWASLLNPVKSAAGRAMTTPFNPNSGAAGLKTAPGTTPATQKTPWLNRDAYGGLSKGDLLLAGMGMLSGRNFGEGLANAAAPLYGAMERRRGEAEKAGEEDALTSILIEQGKMTPEQARAYARFGPQVAISQMNRGEDRATDAERWGKEEEWREKDWNRDGEWRADDVGFRDTQAARDQSRWEAGYGLDLEKFDYTRESDAADRNLRERELKARREAAEAEAKAGRNNPAGLSTDEIKLEADFSNKWMPVQTNYQDIRQQFGRITTLGADTRPDGQPLDPAQRAVNDLALVVAFTKMLDPGSVAREGEVELTKKSASLLGEAQTWLPRLEKGGTLLPEATRKGLVEAARDMMPLYDEAYEKVAGDNINRIQQYGMSPERIMLGYQFKEPEGRVSQAYGMTSTRNAPIADAAVDMLLQDPSSEAVQEFDEAFGPGSADRVLKRFGREAPAPYFLARPNPNYVTR